MLFNYTDRELDLLARIMRAEALGEGNLGMLMVGNVVANRVLADCLTFKNIDSIYDAIYQPNQFTGVNSSLFNASATNSRKTNLPKELSAANIIILLLMLYGFTHQQKKLHVNKLGTIKT